MQNQLWDQIAKYTLLIVSVVASILWYADILSEPAVAVISSIFGLGISILQVESISDKKDNKDSITFKKSFDIKDLIIIALFALLITAIIFAPKSEIIGIKGNNNHDNQVEILN